MKERLSTSLLIPAKLSLWDTVSIVVGIIIGVGIFSAPTEVFRNAPGPLEALAVWALGGLLSLAGALCFAELASTYQRSGGEYVFLTRAYGPAVGFLHAWAQLAVFRTGGSIAAVAYVFGTYAARLWPVADLELFLPTLYAVGAVLVLSAVNILGASPGKHTQNLLTVLKVLGIGGVVVGGFAVAPLVQPTATLVQPGKTSFAGAMIFVLYAYAGWNEAAYLCAEVHDWRRNVPRALILGTLAVTAIYLLYNAACLAALGFAGARASETLPSDVAAVIFGTYGARAMLVLVMISALGSVNGTIFTGGRLYAALGKDHRLFASLGRWNYHWQTPAWSLVVQGAISSAMVVGVGIVWQDQNGFDTLVQCTAPVFWLFFLLAGLSVIVLRFVDGQLDRPFRVPLYPLLPLVFCAWAGYMLYGSIAYAGEQAFVGLAILLAGVPLYFLSRWLDKPRLPAPHPNAAAAAAKETLVRSAAKTRA